MTEEEIRAQREQCADCGGVLEEITVRVPFVGTATAPLNYYANEPKKDIFGTYHVAEGALLAFKCSLCARVVFYGAANAAEKSADDR